MTLNYKPPVGSPTPITNEQRTTLVADLGLSTVLPRLAALETGGGVVTAADDTFLTSENINATGNVLTNDSTTTGSLSVTLFTVAGLAGIFQAGQTATIPNIGTIVIAGTGAYTFTPVNAYNGAVPVVTYQVTNGTSIGQGTLSGTVGAVANPPIAVQDIPAAGTINTPITLSPLTNDSSPDGGALSVTAINGTAVTSGGAAVTTLHAQVSLLTGNVLSVAPTTGYIGTFNFTYTVTDASNGLTAVGTVTCSFADPGAAAVTYYVDAAAVNDAGDGSAGNPKKYIQSGSALMSTFGGDTLVVKNGTYSNALDRIDDTIRKGKPGKWNTIKAQNDGGAILTAGMHLPLSLDDQLVDHYLQIEGFDFNDTSTKSINGRYVKVMRCGFNGGPLTDNTMKLAIGTNDHTPGAEYILVEDCFTYGVGGRYSILAYNSDHLVFRRVVVRHQPGWSDTKGDPQGGLSVYNCQHVVTQNCIAVDIPTMTNLEAGYYHPSNTRASDDIKDYGFIAINVATNAIAWDDGATTPGMLCENAAMVNVGSVAVSNGGAKTVVINKATARTSSGAGIRRYGGGTLSVTNSVGWNLTNGENVGGVTLNGTNNFFNPAVVGEPQLDPASNGILYPVRVEAGSALATAGKGATILKKLGVSGTLWGDSGYLDTTSEDLWPFPQEARIKAAMQAASAYGFCTTGAKRLDGVTDVSLTSYVWEALGNAIPASVYAPAAPVRVVDPVLSGQFVRGGTLTISSGSWTNTPDYYSYQWTRAGVDISSATAPTYTPINLDVGTIVTCRVTATNGTGTSIAFTPSGTSVAEASAPGTVTPTVTGDLFVGGTLTCAPGAVTGAPTPTFSFQWKRGVTNVGTNSATYVAEATGTHTCVVTATNLAGTSNGTSAGVTVGGTITIGDSFVEATPPVNLQSHTATGPNGGFIWSKPGGINLTDHSVIAGGLLRAVGGGVGFQPYIASTVPASADQDIQGTLTFSSAGRTSFLLVGRMSADGLNAYAAWQTNGNWVLYKRSGGTFSVLGTAVESSGGAFTMRLVLRNGLQQLYKNDVLIITATDADSAITAAGRVGLATYYTEALDTNTISNWSATWPG